MGQKVLFIELIKEEGLSNFQQVGGTYDLTPDEAQQISS